MNHVGRGHVVDHLCSSKRAKECRSLKIKSCKNKRIICWVICDVWNKDVIKHNWGTISNICCGGDNDRQRLLNHCGDKCCDCPSGNKQLRLESGFEPHALHCQGKDTEDIITGMINFRNECGFVSTNSSV